MAQLERTKREVAERARRVREQVREGELEERRLEAFEIRRQTQGELERAREITER